MGNYEVVKMISRPKECPDCGGGVGLKFDDYEMYLYVVCYCCPWRFKLVSEQTIWKMMQNGES